MNFFEYQPSCYKLVLSDWSNLEKIAFFTIEASSFQKTHNSKLVANFLRLPVVTHMPKSDKRRKSYECHNTAHMQKCFQNSNTYHKFI
jgi:hypothetical protein